MREYSQPVIVAGMHRSGTSLTASLLSFLSVAMGRQLLPQDSNNRRGYFEDIEFLELQRRMLTECCARNDGGHPDWGWTESESLDRNGFSRFVPEAMSLISSRIDRPGHWGWKDPRTTLMLDFWDGLLKDARYVFVYRFPWDVADSMQRLGAEVFLRNPEYGYRIWTFYNRHIRDFYVKNSDRCLLISINALQENLGQFASILSKKLGFQVCDAELEEIYESDFLRATKSPDPLIDLVAEVWPAGIELLSELDKLADIAGSPLWKVRPVRTRLLRPDSELPDQSKIELSVVTPCYEQGILLIEAIASLERFVPPNCEFIIVNDGSKQPRTLEILEILKRCGYFVIEQQNLGLSAARNRAIALARGRYILPLDDDNRIQANFIEDAIRVLDSSPDVGVVYGDRYEFGLRTGVQQIQEFDLDVLLSRNYIDACAVYRKQVWVDCQGYDSTVSPIEDWELWIHAAEKGWQFHHLPYTTFDYRVRPGSLLSRINSDEICEDYKRRIRAKHSELYWKSSVKKLERMKYLLEAQPDQKDRGSHERNLLSSEIEFRKAQITERDQLIEILMSEAASREEELQAQRVDIALRDTQIARMNNSLGWRLLSSYGRIKYRYLLPLYKFFGARPGDKTGVVEIKAMDMVQESTNRQNISEVKPLSSLITDELLDFGPHIIGATGGSGTRVFARIARLAGLFIGNNLNDSEDAIPIGLYLNQWIKTYLSHYSVPQMKVAQVQMILDLKAALAQHCAPMGSDIRNWGWKEPRSIYLLPFFHSQLPKLKVLHIVRDGRDMAFSSNQNQLYNYGHMLLDDSEQEWSQPIRSIALWSRINLLTAEYGEKNMADSYLRLRFEDLCTEPVGIVEQILNFFGFDADPKQIASSTVCPPKSLSRWRNEDPEILAEMHRIGSAALQKFGYQ